MSKTYSALIIVLVLLVGIAFVTIFNSNKNTLNQPTSPNNNYINISPKDLKGYLDSDKDIYLLDVHIPEQEHIVGTDEFIPFNDIAASKTKLPDDKDTEIVVYCRSGSMSKTASKTLIDIGYTNVKNLTGGINAWKSEGYEQ
jgi:rhodanese-related sulfurtransferase